MVSFSVQSYRSMSCHPGLAILAALGTYFAIRCRSIRKSRSSENDRRMLNFCPPASQITPLSNVDGRRGVACAKKRDERTSIHRHRSLSFAGYLSSFHPLSLIIAVSSSPLYPNVTLSNSVAFLASIQFSIFATADFFLIS